MKTGVLLALSILTLAGSVQAQTPAPAPTQADGEAILARVDRFRARVAAVHAEIGRVSRDPAIPEETRSARIDALSGGLEVEGEAIRREFERLSSYENPRGADKPQPADGQPRWIR